MPPFSRRIRPTKSRSDRPLQRGLADEVALGDQVDGPGEAGVERRDVVVHVLAVQVHAGFQAQRVARAQAGGLDAGGGSAFHRAPTWVAGHADLEAVFAGVAGARDHQFAERRVVHEHGVKRFQCFGGGAGVRQHLPDFLARVRALHGDRAMRVAHRGAG